MTTGIDRRKLNRSGVVQVASPATLLHPSITATRIDNEERQSEAVAKAVEKHLGRTYAEAKDNKSKQ